MIYLDPVTLERELKILESGLYMGLFGTVAVAARAYLADNPPPPPRDHVIVVFERANGSTRLFKVNGQSLMTKDDAMTRAKVCSEDFQSCTYTVVQVGP